MNKRQFLIASAASAALWPTLSTARKRDKPDGPILLTLSGNIDKANRGAFDPALDQMMSKQKVRFDRALTLDYPMLLALKPYAIRPTLEYDQRPHVLFGPRLEDVIQLAGVVPASNQTRLLLRAVDGYAVTISLADVRKYRFILATHLDNRPMPLGGLGPLWAVYDADQFPEMRAKPLNARFAMCPWALYHIEIHSEIAANPVSHQMTDILHPHLAGI